MTNGDKLRAMSNEELEKTAKLFEDPYFRSLTPEEVLTLAKKSIRLTDQHIKDTDRIETLKNALQSICDCLSDSFGKTIERTKEFQDAKNALKGLEHD